MALKPSHNRHQLEWKFASCDQAIQTKNSLLPPPSADPYKKRAPSKWDDAEKWLICYDNSSLNYIDKLSIPLVRNISDTDISHVKGSQSAHDLALKNLSSRIRKDRTGGSMEHGNGRGKSRMKDVGIEVSPSLSCRDMGTQVTPFQRFAAATNPALSSTPPVMRKESTSPIYRRHCNTPSRRSIARQHGFLMGFKNSSNDRGPSDLELEEIGPVARLGLLSNSATFLSVPMASNSAKLNGNIGSDCGKQKEENPTTKINNPTNTTVHQCSCSMKEGIAWEECELAKLDAKYNQQEAKIKAWVNLKRAKANAELRKLELKLERLRSQAMERAMRKVTRAHVKAEEMRKAIEVHHAQQCRKVAQKEKEPRRLKCFGGVLRIQNLICNRWP